MSETRLLLDELNRLRAKIAQLEARQEHRGFAASDVARTDIAETFTDDVTVEGDLTVDLDATITGDANVTGDVLATGIVQAAAAWIPGVAVSLDAKLYCGFNGDEPFETDYAGSSTGHRGQTGTETGGVIYRPGKFGKAVQIAVATTNLVTNPSFEAGTTGWAGDAGTAISQSSDFAVVGTYSLKAVATSGNLRAYASLGTLAIGTYTASVRVRTGATGTGVRLSIYNATDGHSYSSYVYPSTDREWVTITHTKTTTAAEAVYVYVAFSATGTFYIDAAQLEARAYVTPYCDGSLGSGHSWSGTAHASTSSRTGTSLTYSVAAAGANPSVGTISMWVYATGWNSVGGVLWSLGNANGEFDSYINSSGTLFVRENGTENPFNLGSSYLNTWFHLAFTWDVSANAFKAYVNGIQRISRTLSLPTFHTLLGVGYSPTIGTTYVHNGMIDDFALLSRAATADEIRAIYESQCQLICS